MSKNEPTILSFSATRAVEKTPEARMAATSQKVLANTIAAINKMIRYDDLSRLPIQTGGVTANICKEPHFVMFCAIVVPLLETQPGETPEQLADLFIDETIRPLFRRIWKDLYYEGANDDNERTEQSPPTTDTEH